MIDNKILSKVLSHALRHEPKKYNIVLDKDGWVNIDNLIIGLRENLNEYSGLIFEDIFEAVNASNKKRHEFKGNMIRAIYGHSTEVEINYTELIPPDILYHGTSKEATKLILAEGLKPMQRQYVHLSSNIDSAYIVGKRKEYHPAILSIKSGEAYSHGVSFYFAHGNVWLTEFVPSEFIHTIENL